MRTIALLIGTLAAVGCPCLSAAQTSCDAMGYLSDTIKDPKTTLLALNVLRATGDSELLPLFSRGLQSRVPEIRMYGVSSLAELAGKGAADQLVKPLLEDEDMRVRSAALARLVEMDAAKPQHLLQAMEEGDEKVRCLAAGALVNMGKGQAARQTLEELTKSANTATAGMASLSLMKLGQKEYAAGLTELVEDPDTSELVLALWCEQVEDQEIKAAAPIVEKIATSKRSDDLKVRAFKAALTVSGERGVVLLYNAIDASANPVYRIRLLKMLSERKDSAAPLRTLARGTGPVAGVAKFELARARGGAVATRYAEEAVDAGHLVMVAYVISRAAADVEKDANAATFYVPALVKFLNALDGREKSLGPQHMHASMATQVLVDIGAADGIEAVKKLLAARYGARTRAVTMGLLRVKSKIAAELAEPLLESPYPALARDAALAMGRFGHKVARPTLAGVVNSAKRDGAALACLASWQILKIDGETKPAAKTLATVLP
ncbi:MAG: HEAT repeat domain-containing protein [Phycisphaerae bacterium]